MKKQLTDPAAAGTNPFVWVTNGTAGNDTVTDGDKFRLTFSEVLTAASKDVVEDAVEAALTTGDANVTIATSDYKSFTLTYDSGAGADEVLAGGVTVTIAANSVSDKAGNDNNAAITFTIAD